MKVKVIGAGLAGSEAAWQLAKRGIEVELYEMKPEKMTPAHHSADFQTLGRVPGVIHLIHQTGGQTNLVAVSAVTGGGGGYQLALG